MTVPEQTAQQLDPLGTLSGRRLTFVGAMIAFVYSLVATGLTFSQVVRPGLALAALIALAVACTALVLGSSPSRAPLTRRRQWTVLAGVLLAYLLSTASQWGQNDLIRDDWGPIAVGVTLLAFGPYRPSRDILYSGLVATVIVAAVTVISVPHLTTSLSPFLIVTIATTPIVGMALAAAAFSRSIVASLSEWREQVQQAREIMGSDAREGVARSVQQDRVTILNRDVVPFLSEVLERNTVNDGDHERARLISDSIRRVMVSEAQRTWVEELLETRPSGGAQGVRDAPVRARRRDAHGTTRAAAGPATADLTTADLTAADLTAADLTTANLTAADSHTATHTAADTATAHTAAARATATATVTPAAAPRPAVDDPERLADRMNADQRATLRAIAVALLEDPALEPGSIHISFESEGDECCATLRARLQLGNGAVRSTFAPYFAVFRATFDGVRVDVRRATLALQFSYARG